MGDRDRSRSPEAGGNPPAAAEEEVKLYIGNLDYGACISCGVARPPLLMQISCRELDSERSDSCLFLFSQTATDETRLRDEFSPFGTVTDVFLPIDRNTSRPRGYVVEFDLD